MSTMTETQETAIIASAATAAERRRSIRTYASRVIDEADLRELLRLAGRAPSAFNVQPWRFVVVQDDALKAKLSEAAYNQQQVVRAPATIVLYSDMEEALVRAPDAWHPDVPADKRDAGVAGLRATFAKKTIEERAAFGAEQSNIALGYLLLLAESFGFATSPMLGFDPEKVKALLELPAHVKIPAIISIGYAGEEGARPHRLSEESLVQFR